MHLTPKEVVQESTPICFNPHRAKVRTMCMVATPVMGRCEGPELVKVTVSLAIAVLCFSRFSRCHRELYGEVIPVDGRLGTIPNSPGKE